ncbi:MAG: translation elongation factor-like protein [Candidatus Omnitrophica bacterium CG11_big_fil_rev_8_21_14_0_20_45_26]|uniref:Translation elongation factor-like protein n=1 Tax=Candidatus Abzuiibacterium crystallinum TaxID=1974748 RepID=A0A2H0LSA1_9BACT|nr:MAG: translation elongation factor-like protein [Candidatus Omnitrophica bacterium CG11_big_fil_rev_8_21_14_0_20_45_26]PIW65060.1 MAG: translation elongation factor-like protein [Candidatus Omnitrophica bacterium CG12_big_fil_rev_8_21_14_0_65_45_16]
MIGAITHYFPHVHAGVLILRSGQLKRGDRIYIKGHTTDFKQIVDSLQIDRVNIETAKKGDEIGIAVKKRVRVGDEVYLIG